MRDLMLLVTGGGTVLDLPLSHGNGVAILMIGVLGFRFRTGDKAVLKQGFADVVVFVLAAVLIVPSALTLAR